MTKHLNDICFQQLVIKIYKGKEIKTFIHVSVLTKILYILNELKTWDGFISKRRNGHGVQEVVNGLLVIHKREREGIPSNGFNCGYVSRACFIERENI